MTVYEQELRKLFEHSNLVDQPQFSLSLIHISEPTRQLL